MSDGVASLQVILQKQYLYFWFKLVFPLVFVKVIQRVYLYAITLAYGVVQQMLDVLLADQDVDFDVLAEDALVLHEHSLFVDI